MKFKIILLWMILSSLLKAQIYVSTTGSDSNPGTQDFPFATIPHAVSSAHAGDSIYVRGGTYVITTAISISKSGTSGSKYYLFAYPGERPILDFSSMSVSSGNRGISLSGSYWSVRGIDIKGAGDNGMYMSGSNNVVENCAFYENRDTGLQLSGGASNNRIINCDSYYNADPGQGNADGFAVKLDVGTGNHLHGCRSWQNSDDGFDGYLRPSNDITTTLDSCWIFKNGYLKNGNASVGNGNGFKLGGSDSVNLMHNIVVTNCLSFDNRVKGFDQNNNKGSITLYNCTSYNNGTNYKFTVALNSGKILTLKNCVALGPYGSLGNWAVQSTNGWISPFSVTNSDFLSTDPSAAYGPRKADGSLPDITYMHLAPGSDLIDAGTDVGIPFNGSGPDLGAFERSGPPLPTYTLTLNGANGAITPFPNRASYDSNTTVQLTAVPATGYHFVNWGGDLSDSVNPSSVVMSGNKNVTANFALDQYALSAYATHGSVTKNPENTLYDTNSTVQLTAIPATGYHFVNWTGDLSGSANPALIIMNGNKSVTANFAINQFTLGTSSLNGSIARNPELSLYDSNSTAQLTALPATGYHFVSWGGDVLGSTNPISILMDGNKTVTANFVIDQYMLTLNAVNGLITPNPQQTLYNSGSSVQLTAVPDTGYHFVSWSGAIGGTLNPISVAVDSNMSITAEFAVNELQQFSLTINATNGTVVKLPDQASYYYGTLVHLVAIPNRGYHFVSWSGDTTATSDTLVVIMDRSKTLTSNYSITAYSMKVKAKWNMVSLSYAVPDAHPAILFPSASSAVFMFTNQYATAATIFNGEGYWIKFPKDSILTVMGSELLVDTIDVDSSWNMIGSISRAISTNDVQSSQPNLIQSFFYGYNNGYVLTDSLRPGNAYWVKAGMTGKIYLGGSGTSATRTVSRMPQVNSLSFITITDHAGSSGKLFFGPQEDNTISTALFDLPPVGPRDMFDIRFRSNRFVASYPEKLDSSMDYEINLSGIEYPITVKWHAPGESSKQFVLCSEIGEKIELVGDGAYTFRQSAKSLSLVITKATELPRQFNLGNNYPNPFNPSTSFSVAVPMASPVEIGVYNILGMKVRTLVDGEMSAGVHTVQWDGTTDHKTAVSSGLYFVRMVSGTFSDVRKILLMK